MNKIILALLVSTIATSSGAVVIDEIIMAKTRTQGRLVYTTCIVTPPLTPPQQAYCGSIYASYVSSQQALNAPLPLMLAMDQSPYSWSQYDVCRYEPSQMAFDNPVVQPFCPSVPI